MGTPNPELRTPKEVRTPKAEGGRSPPASDLETRFDVWGEEAQDETLRLREDAGGPSPPRRDLLERTAKFGEAIVRFAKTIPQTPVNNRLIDQLVGAGTSVPANYCEADDAVSGKDYRNKIGTCRKESKEAMLFLRMVAASEDRLAPEARTLWREAKELNLIFGAIWRKS